MMDRVAVSLTSFRINTADELLRPTRPARKSSGSAGMNHTTGKYRWDGENKPTQAAGSSICRPIVNAMNPILTSEAAGTSISMIVTGASRGFGRAIAIACGERFLKNSCSPSISAAPQLYLRLVARSKEGLEETLRSLPGDPRLKVSFQLADLSDSKTIEETVDVMLDFWRKSIFESGSKHRCIFINNAGSLGYIGPTQKYPSLQVLQEAVALNVTNALWMSTQLALFATVTDAHVTLVNVSSLLAVQPMPTLATYSATKAARDSFHTALALEESPRLRVLNYAPGPLQTDMARELQTNAAVADAVRPFSLLDPLDTARILMQLLEDDTFVNGAHVDYFDCI
jgi:sepiapterin reductase